jgi:hypothetical protein
MSRRRPHQTRVVTVRSLSDSFSLLLRCNPLPRPSAGLFLCRLSEGPERRIAGLVDSEIGLDRDWHQPE